MSVEKEKCFFVVVIVGFTLAVSSTPYLAPSTLSTHRYSLNVDSHPGWPWHVDGRQASSFNDLLTLTQKKVFYGVFVLCTL